MKNIIISHDTFLIEQSFNNNFRVDYNFNRIKNILEELNIKIITTKQDLDILNKLELGDNILCFSPNLFNSLDKLKYFVTNDFKDFEHYLKITQNININL